MVYKKYIKKDGKLFGPYYYRSRRDKDGRVITEYISKESPKPKKNSDFFSKINYAFLVSAGILLFLLLSIIFYDFFYSTGLVTLDIRSTYFEGEQLKGVIDLNLKSGELIPKDSKLTLNMGDQEKEVYLSDILTENLASGDYYAENIELSGSGDGYGVAGEKKVYPEIDFDLLVLSEAQETENQTTNPEVENETETTEPTIPEETPAEENTSEQIPAEPIITEETSTEETPTEISTDESPSEPSTSESSGITGASISENEFIVHGKISQDNDFSYNLEEGQTASIVPGSVKFNGTEISDNNVHLEETSDNVVVKTDYFIIESGFGKDYSGDETLSIPIKIDSLNMVTENATLDITLKYQDSIIAETSKEINVVTATNLTQNETENNETIFNQTDITVINETIFNETNVTLTNETILNLTSNLSLIKDIS